MRFCVTGRDVPKPETVLTRAAVDIWALLSTLKFGTHGKQKTLHLSAVMYSHII